MGSDHVVNTEAQNHLYGITEKDSKKFINYIEQINLHISLIQIATDKVQTFSNLFFKA